jgi:hypothetical protein
MVPGAGPWGRALSDTDMIKQLLLTAGLVSLFAIQAVAREESLLARVTVYWATGIAKWDRAHATGARLRPGHCAVDPKKIPYGTKVFFPDGPCVAVDTGPAVINRKAARLSGRNRHERRALVVDRYFETKEQALAWERTHPHFMTLRILSPGSRSEPPVEPPQSKATQVAQTEAPPPIVQAPPNAQPPPIARRQSDFAVAIMVKLPDRDLISSPPSYHRRRFAADEPDESELPPLDWTARPIKRGFFV